MTENENEGHLDRPGVGLTKADIEARFDYLRGEIRAERISYDEIAELQSLAAWIDPDDATLLEWAGVDEEKRWDPKQGTGMTSRLIPVSIEVVDISNDSVSCDGVAAICRDSSHPEHVGVQEIIAGSLPGAHAAMVDLLISKADVYEVVADTIHPSEEG